MFFKLIHTVEIRAVISYVHKYKDSQPSDNIKITLTNLVIIIINLF